MACSLTSNVFASDRGACFSVTAKWILPALPTRNQRDGQSWTAMFSLQSEAPQSSVGLTSPLTMVISLIQKPQFLERLITTTEAPPYIAGALAKWRHGRHKIIKWPTSTNHVLQAVKHCEKYLSQIFTVVTQSKSFRYSVAQSGVRN